MRRASRAFRARGLGAAVRFLTRVPWPAPPGAGALPFEQEMAGALVFFPLVGALVGAAAALVLWTGAQFWPLSVAVLLALSAEALLTGALHEDAAADVFDAFGGGARREDVLRILKDSRIGAFGLVGLGLLLALRAGALAAAGGVGTAAAILVASGALGRLAMLILMVAVPPVPGSAGLAGRVAAGAGPATVPLSVLPVLPLLGWVAWDHPRAILPLLALLAGFLFWFGRLVRRRIGGSTGDCVGMAGYAAIVLTTLVLSAGR